VAAVVGNQRVRGSTVSLTEGSGTASQVGVTISGVVRKQWFNVPLPVPIPQTVSLSPSADNVYGLWFGTTAITSADCRSGHDGSDLRQFPLSEDQG